jgi:tight adherence protein C
MWAQWTMFFGVAGIVYSLLSFALRERLAIRHRADLLAGVSPERSLSTFASVWSGLTKSVLSLADRLTPRKFAGRTEMLARSAGVRGASALRRAVAVRSALLLAGLLMAVLLCVTHPSIVSFETSVCALAGAVAGPNIYWQRRARHAQHCIRRELPALLDMLTISVEAGLGFDQALARTVRDLDTPLGAEMRQVLQEMQLGKTRREALRDSAQRVHVEDFQTWIHALVQADRLGMGIGQVLRVQADEARRKMRQQAEERAMKAPVKILFPLVLFLFPGLFIIILGPAMIRILHALSGL